MAVKVAYEVGGEYHDLVIQRATTFEYDAEDRDVVLIDATGAQIAVVYRPLFVAILADDATGDIQSVVPAVTA